VTAGDPGFGGAPGPPGRPLLVAAELRGYRRFRLTDAGLMPTVHAAAGPWAAPVHVAGCRSGRHSAPDPGCGCGLYGWYHPADARGTYGGDVTAVIAARGRTVLGDHGFRAGAARVQAVSLPGLLARRRSARTLLARRYPQAVVYRSRRRMLRDHPPDDLTALGITVRRSTAGRYRCAALTVWAVGVLALYSVVGLPPGAVAHAPPAPLLGGLAAIAAWQALLVRLTTRCLPAAPRPGQSPGPGSRWPTSSDASPV
jgi:hypothetical protein